MKFVIAFMQTFTGVLLVKFLIEVTSRVGENCYLTLDAVPAASAGAVVTLLGALVTRKIIRDGDNVALAAAIVAGFLATLYGGECDR